MPGITSKMAAVRSSPSCPQIEISPAPDRKMGVLLGVGAMVDFGVGVELETGVKIGRIV